MPSWALSSVSSSTSQVTASCCDQEPMLDTVWPTK